MKTLKKLALLLALIGTCSQQATSMQRANRQDRLLLDAAKAKLELVGVEDQIGSYRLPAASRDPGQHPVHLVGEHRHDDPQRGTWNRHSTRPAPGRPSRRGPRLPRRIPHQPHHPLSGLERRLHLAHRPDDGSVFH